MDKRTAHENPLPTALLRKAGYPSLKALAQKVGVCRSTLQHISRGCGTTTETYTLLCRALRVESLRIPHLDSTWTRSAGSRVSKVWPIRAMHMPYIKAMAEHHGIEDVEWLAREVSIGGYGWGSTAGREELSP